jgi:hypothetical protein
MACSTCAKYEIGSTIGYSKLKFEDDFYVITEEIQSNACHSNGVCYCNNCRATYLWYYENLIQEKLQLQFHTKQRD